MLIRGVSGFIEMRGQVVIKIVIRRGAFYLAKKWGAIAPQPPFTYAPAYVGGGGCQESCLRNQMYSLRITY